MVWRFLARCGHRQRAAGCGQVFGTSMWVCFDRAGGGAFAFDCHKYRGIVWLVAQGAGFAILNSKIGPVIVDLKCERRAGDSDIMPEIFCDIETSFFVA